MAISFCGPSSRQQQVGDVRAGNQQNYPDRPQQHQQGRANLADQLFIQRRLSNYTVCIIVGVCCSSRLAIVFISAWACSTVTPAFSRLSP